MIYFPPKPLLISIDQSLFSELELRENVICEPKLNGTRLVLYRHINSNYEFWNRHGQPIKYTPSRDLLSQLALINWPNGECVLDGELLHSKTKNVKHTVYIFDVYLWDSQPTINEPFGVRRVMLEAKVPQDMTNVVLAPQWKGGPQANFRKLYEELIQHEEIEGIVIKSLKAKVVLGRTTSKVVPTMWKVRRPEVSKITGMKRIRF